MAHLLDIGVVWSNITALIILITLDSPKSIVTSFIFHEKHNKIFTNIPMAERIELVNNFIAINEKEVISNKRRVKVERYSLNTDDSFANVTRMLEKLPKPPTVEMTRSEQNESESNNSNVARSNFKPYGIKLPEPLDRWLYRDVNSIMKEKLFRLMYETYKYADLTIAKLMKIKEQMDKKSNFVAGYLLANIFMRYEKMLSISGNMRRAFDSWKAIEHVNGYERIHQLSEEIKELIDELRLTEWKIHDGVEEECDPEDIECIMDKMNQDPSAGMGGYNGYNPLMGPLG